MKQILVPTDFSPASKSGIRFAIRWASQQKVELIFFHALNILIPTRWSQDKVERYASEEIEACYNRFTKFIHSIYGGMHLDRGKYSTVVVPESDPVRAILTYCRNNRSVDCICVSTNGAGAIKKLFGTNTSELIAKSPIPVMAIPGNYKARPVKTVLYATDLRNYHDELDIVRSFSAAFQARIDVLHLAWSDEPGFEKEALEKISDGYEHGLTVSVEAIDPSLRLAERLQQSILKRKPSIVVMFSDKSRNMIQNLFYSSESKELSFNPKTPLLVYSKTKSIHKTGKRQLA